MLPLLYVSACHLSYMCVYRHASINISGSTYNMSIDIHVYTDCLRLVPTSNFSLVMNICQRNYSKLFAFTQSKEIC